MWRLVGLCCCAEARLEVLKLTKHLEDGTIRARWSFRCLPFHSLLLHFYQKDKSHLYRCVRVSAVALHEKQQVAESCLICGPLSE